jgi:hypothetical protein
MSTNQIVKRSDRISGLQALKDGLGKHAQTMIALVINGVTFKMSDVITALDDLVKTAEQVVDTRAAWQAAVAEDKTKGKAQKAFVAGVKQAVRVAFGQQIDALADFDLKPRKTPAPRTPEQKAAAAAKGKATRALRHTMGAKQKAAIKATVGTTAPAASPPQPPAPAAGTQPTKA